jgi:hypothetical protein
MPYKYSFYLKNVHYNKILDFCWYDDLKKKLDILEQNKIKINFMELNKYLYDRMLYETGQIYNFDDNKYSIENYMQIVSYNPSCKGYEADDEMNIPKQIDFNFINVMNGLAEKLDKFSISI